MGAACVGVGVAGGAGGGVLTSTGEGAIDVGLAGASPFCDGASSGLAFARLGRLVALAFSMSTFSPVSIAVCGIEASVENHSRIVAASPSGIVD